jgi:hypothetical protein
MPTDVVSSNLDLGAVYNIYYVIKFDRQTINDTDSRFNLIFKLS